MYAFSLQLVNGRWYGIVDQTFVVDASEIGARGNDFRDLYIYIYSVKAYMILKRTIAIPKVCVCVLCGTLASCAMNWCWDNNTSDVC